MIIDSQTKTVDYEALCQAIWDADVQFANDASEVIREDYSGRAMYGGTCFGLTPDDGESAVICTLIQLSHAATPDDDDIEHDVMELAKSMRSDSMGLGGIWYFPGWTLVNLPESDDEDEDDD